MRGTGLESSVAGAVRTRAPAHQHQTGGLMSLYTPAGGGERGDLAYDYDDAHGQGLVTFAGVMLSIAAVLNIVYGIAAISKAHFFVGDARYVFGSLSTWGWFLLALGIMQAFAAFAIWRGASWGRWFGVACASVNAILQMFWIPAYPVLAMTILGLDIIAIYGLLAYGGRRRAYHAERDRAQSADRVPAQTAGH
jgi:hypothetical protein